MGHDPYPNHPMIPRTPVPAPRCRPVACVVKSPPRRCLDGDAAKGRPYVVMTSVGKWRNLQQEWPNGNPWKSMVNFSEMFLDVQMIYGERTRCV